jgi:serralysin
MRRIALVCTVMAIGVLLLGGGVAIAKQIQGDAKNNRLVGTERRDFIYGFGGDDTINGKGDDDELYGSQGRDGISGNDGVDEVYGGSANDRVRGGDGNDEVYGGSGTDNLSGGKGFDYLSGGVNSDTILSVDGRANDTVSCGTGDDDRVLADEGDLVLGDCDVTYR